MKAVHTLFLSTILVSFFCFTGIGQENPYIHMAGKKYAGYSHELSIECQKFFELDTLEARKVIRQIEEVAEKSGRIEWKLFVSYFELELYGRKRSLYGNNLYPIEELLSKAIELLQESEKADVIHLELIVRQKIVDYYWIFSNNYELAFEQYGIIEERLKTVFSENIPEKAEYYRRIAEAYYYFKDYPKAISYFNMVLREEDNSRSVHSKQHARNGLGLSYRYGYNDLDRSDSYFFALAQGINLDPIFEYYHEAWKGISEGNIGENMVIRKEYNKAIPLLKSSIEKMLKYSDYAFTSGSAVKLAQIYLKKGAAAEAKRYLDMAVDFNLKIPRDGRLPQIYETISKYYATIGNTKLSIAYMDSTLIANKHLEDQFNAIKLMRVEQRNHSLEQKAKDEQLKAEKVRNAGYRRNLAITFTGLLLVGGVLVLYLILYLKKKAAYRELARKSQEWAQVKIINTVQQIKQDDVTETVEKDLQNDMPDATDFSIMKDIERLMLEEKLYKETALSVDSLAKKLGVKRYHVSVTINRCTKKNFNTFVNEYRIKHAVRNLSASNIKTFSIEGIAFDSGFNDSRNFHRVFKKMTGLSPTEFIKNIGE